MCRRKPEEGQCGTCQAVRYNGIMAKLDALCSLKKLKDYTAEELIRQAFHLGVSLRAIK